MDLRSATFTSRLRYHSGMSLVEATIILMVLMLLTGVLSPSIGDFVSDAKHVKVKEDCEAIGVSVMRLMRDVGECLKFDGTERCFKENRVDILYSDGPDVNHGDVDSNAQDFSHADIAQSPLNWWYDEKGDSLEHQLVENGNRNGPQYGTPSNSVPAGASIAGPHFNLGWRGAYVSSPVGPDPWGRRYLVNSVFLSVAYDATEGQAEGQRSGGWSYDSFCLSAGSNRIYETGFANPSCLRNGDDFVYVISGDTR